MRESTCLKRVKRSADCAQVWKAIEIENLCCDLQFFHFGEEFFQVYRPYKGKFGPMRKRKNLRGG